MKRELQKKNILKSLFFIGFLVICISTKAQTTNPSPYCYPYADSMSNGTCTGTGGSSGYGFGISSIHWNSNNGKKLLRTSTCYGNSNLDVYRFWSDSVLLKVGDFHQFSIQTPSNNNGLNISAGFWIDTNQNNQFDSFEFFGSFFTSNKFGTNYTMNFSLPCMVKKGKTRMRIKTQGFSKLSKHDACITPSGYGETWDFEVTIVNHIPLISDFELPDTVYVKNAITLKSMNIGNTTEIAYDVNIDGTYEYKGLSNTYTIPQFQFSSPGTKCIRSRITNCLEKITVDKCIQVIAPTQVPNVDFYACRRNVEQYESVQLFSSTKNGAWQWKWDVYDSLTYADKGIYLSLKNGDVISDPNSTGNNEYSENPEFTFDIPGTYTVVLEAKNDVGSSMTLKKSIIKSVSPQYLFMVNGNYVQKVTANSGIIQSYGYPNYPYVNKLNSYLLIEPPAKQKLTLAFKDIQLADVNDSLLIYDDDKQNSSKLIGFITSADNGTNPSFKSTGETIFLYFKTDSSGVAFGFNANYYIEGWEPDTLGFEIKHSVLEVNKKALFYNRFNNKNVSNFFYKWLVDGVEQVSFENSDSLKVVFTDTVNHRVCLVARNCDTTYTACKMLRFNEGIIGKVYNDTNNNCSLDSLEKGISNIPVVLFDSSNVEISTAYTNSKGEFNFTVPFGRYKLALDSNIKKYQTTCSSMGNKVNVVLNTTNPIEKNVHFDLLDIGISGLVYLDKNKNCLMDSGDQKLSNIVVKLYDSAMMLLTSTTTNFNGSYRFDPSPGKYYVAVFLNTPKYAFTCPSNGLSGLISIGAKNKSRTNLDFGLGEYGIQGYIYRDVNANCTREKNESTYNDIRVRLLDSNEKLITYTYSKPDGSYVFYVDKGTYKVQADVGALPLKSKCNPKGFSYQVVLDSVSYFKENINFDLDGIDSGIFGRIFGDLNSNCILDYADNYFSGIPINLYDSNNNVIDKTSTDRNGNYFFDLGFGKYKVGIRFANLPYQMHCGQDSISSLITLDTAKVIAKHVDFNLHPVYINGTVYKDLDSNCVFSSGDIGFNKIKIRLYDSLMNYKGAAYTNTKGEYTFYQKPGKYTVVLDTINLPFRPSCSNALYDSTVNLLGGNAKSPEVNFELNCGSQFDIGVKSIVINSLVFPGRNHSIAAWIGDLRNEYLSKKLGCRYNGGGTVQITVHGKVGFKGEVQGSKKPTVNGNTYTYSISDFSDVNMRSDFGLIFKVDTNAQAGDTIRVWVLVSPTTGDVDSNNNRKYIEYYVRNSYDPNIKEVYPNTVYPGFKDWLTYTVHFQNTGTAPAFDVVVKDTLDAQLDAETFEVLSSSHEMEASLFDGVLKFNFKDINLPDSFSDLKGSEGFVQFRIKPKQGVVLGSQIKNKAHIFFDYNAPIVTNTVGTEYVKDNYVLIPDPNFVLWLQANHGGCMKGNKMDTTCGSVLNATEVKLPNQGIADLEGLQYFKALRILDCSFNLLSNLPAMRVALQELNCSNNQFIILNIKTTSLKILNCSDNKLTELPALPAGLMILDCANNSITCFDPFNKNLSELKIEGNKNTCLPNYVNAMDTNTSKLPLCLKNDAQNNPNTCISTVTAIQNIQSSQFAIYPNPSKGSFTLTFEGTLENVNMQLEIINSLGQIVYTRLLTQNQASFDLSEIADGVYFLRVNMNGQVVYKPILIQQ